MSDTGAIAPTSASQNGTGISSPATWTGTSNTFALDGVYATSAAVFSGGASQTNWIVEAFPDMAVPSGATINGIEVVDHAFYSFGGPSAVGAFIKIGSVSKTDGSGFFGSQSWSTTLTAHTYGGPTDLWGGSWVPSDFSSPSVSIHYEGLDDDATFKLDFISLKVYYTASGPTPRDITASAKLSRFPVANVTGAGRFSIPHSKDASASARLSLIHNKDVSTSSTFTRAGTKDVTASAALSRAVTKDVSGGAVLTLSGESEIAASAVISPPPRGKAPPAGIGAAPPRLPAGFSSRSVR